MMRSTKPVVLLYVLLAYVLLQFAWWAWLIYDLNEEVLQLTLGLEDKEVRQMVRSKLFMILGEGAVFISLLLIGAFYIRRFLLREHRLARQERNFLLATTHELNSPLAGIKLNLQTLQRTDLNDEKRQLMTAGALSNVKRLEVLLSNMLTASRIDAGKMTLMREEVDLKLLVEKCLDQHHAQLQEAAITCQASLAPVTVVGDAMALEMVINNLIQNAIKYAAGNPLKCTLVSKEQEAILQVADSGQGIRPENTERIFQKFFREQNEEIRSQKGSGLGLYLSNELIKLHGGAMFAELNQPNGLLITLNIPLHESK